MSSVPRQTVLVSSRARFWARVSVIAWYLGLAALYLPWRFETLGGVLITAGLLAGVLLAPPEYALGALASAFLAASCSGLWVSFQSLRWLFLGMGAAIFSVRFIVPRPGGTGPPRALSAFSILLGFFVVASVATVFTTVARELTVLKLAAFLFLLYVGFRGTGPLVSMYGAAGPRRLIKGLLAYPMALVTLSLLVHFLLRSLTGPNGRFVGILGHPNSWGALIATVLPWMFPPLFRRSQEKGFHRLFFALVVILVGYTLALTSSRAALLGVICALAIFCAVHADRRIGAIALLGTVFITFQSLSNPDMWQQLGDRYLYKYDAKRKGQAPAERQAFQSRLAPWKRAQANFQENPWLGLGFGITSKAEASWSTDIHSGSTAVETGSSFWGGLGQVGVLGSVPLFLALLILVFQSGLFAWKVKDPWFTAIYASLFALVTNAAFEGWLLAPGNFIGSYFWIQCFLVNTMMTRFRPAAIHHAADYIPKKFGPLPQRQQEAVAGPAALG